MTILRYRVKRLLSNLEALEAEFPGIIRAVIKHEPLPNNILLLDSDKLKGKVTAIITDLYKLMGSSYEYTCLKVLNKFNYDYNSNSQLVSTKAYGKIIGIDATPYLFDNLVSLGLSTKKNNRYELTHKGLNVGRYLNREGGEEFIGWEKHLLDKLLSPLKNKLFRNLNFKLFQITHFSNLNSILEHGLYCHNDIKKYHDISNLAVNKIRSKLELVHNQSIHDYVPLYFNPRNAMLFQKQKDYVNQLVILEIDRNVIQEDYCLFSEGNAARKDAKITHSKIKVNDFDWEEINGTQWSENGVVDEKRKALMMSECLIYKHIPSKYIKYIHCKNEITKVSLDKYSKKFNVSIDINPHIFF